jgi:type II secretory pathway component PulC
MKKLLGLLAILVTGATAMAQGTPQQQRELKHDVIKEREKRHEVAKDVLRGQPDKARADHNAAVSYHKEIHQDTRQMRATDRNRAHSYVQHRPVKHHRMHRTTVVVHH